MRARGTRPGVGRATIGTGIVLMAVGGVIAFGVQAPDEVEKYVDVLDVGLILVWAGILVLVMQVVMHRRRRPRGQGMLRDRTYDPDRTDQWYERDVHRPGYAGQTRRLPTVRDR
jgi:hypothetical protein